MDEENVQRAAKLLLNGATMLHITCPVCKDPIYQLRDKSFFCATCNQPVIFQVEGSSQEKSEIIESKLDPIQNKIAQLSKQLENESDPDKIIELASLIKKLENLS